MNPCEECGGKIVTLNGSELNTHVVGCSKMLEPHVSVFTPGTVTLNIVGSAAYVEDTFGRDVQGIAVAASRGFSVAREYLAKLAAVVELARRVAEGKASKLVLVGALAELDAMGFAREPECQEDAASCDCAYHENLARAEASHGNPDPSDP